MFINYNRSPFRETNINERMARAVIGLYLVWKLLSYDWETLGEWPAFILSSHSHSSLIPFASYTDAVQIQVWLVIGLLAAFVTGYRPVVTGGLGALLIVHLAAIHVMVTNHRMTLLATYLLIFLLIFEARRALVLRQSDRKRKPADAHSPGRVMQWRHDGLRWAQVTIAATYFLVACNRLMSGDLGDWVSSKNLNMVIHYNSIMYLDSIPLCGRFIMAHPLLGWLGACGTMMFETGLLVAVLARRTVTPWLLGISCMHISIGLTMRLWFIDQLILFMCFFAWDDVYKQTIGRHQPAVAVAAQGNGPQAQVTA